MEVQSKPWYESITIWGVLITLVAAALGYMGMNIGPDTTQAAIDIVPKAIEAIKLKDWVELISLIVGLVGSAMATTGRNQAAQPVHFFKPFSVNVDHLVTKGANDSKAKAAA